MLWVHGHYTFLYSFSAGTDVRFLRIKVVPALKGLNNAIEYNRGAIIISCTVSEPQRTTAEPLQQNLQHLGPIVHSGSGMGMHSPHTKVN